MSTFTPKGDLGTLRNGTAAGSAGAAIPNDSAFVACADERVGTARQGTPSFSGVRPITALGGVITRVGNTTYHTFDDNGVFDVTDGHLGATFTVTIIAGGGGGSGHFGGGGGGVFSGSITAVLGSIAIVVGLGGAPGVVGGDSSFGATTVHGGSIPVGSFAGASGAPTGHAGGALGGSSFGGTPPTFADAYDVELGGGGGGAAGVGGDAHTSGHTGTAGDGGLGFAGKWGGGGAGGGIATGLGTATPGAATAGGGLGSINGVGGDGVDGTGGGGGGGGTGAGRGGKGRIIISYDDVIL